MSSYVNIEKNEALSTQILDYYYKYGQNRDLEKFLRLRKSFNRTPSEGSLYLPSHPSINLPEARCKSSEGLDSHDSTEKEEYTLDAAKEEVAIPPEANKVNEYQEIGLDESQPDNSTKLNKRLEWDSLADVGYNKSHESGKTSSLERSISKNIFTDHGIKITFPEMQDSISSATGMKHPEPKLSTKPIEKWRQTLENVKMKYDKENFDVPTSFSKYDTQRFTELSLNKHSTPKQLYSEKSMQTSLTQMQCKEVQVNLSSKSSILTAPKADEICENTLSSFEFITHNSPIEKNTLQETDQYGSIKNSKKSHKTSSTTSSTSENTTDLELGIKLICSLIEAKSLSKTKKISLARKIVSRIVDQKSSISSTSNGNSNNMLIIDSSQSSKELINNCGSTSKTSTLGTLESDLNAVQRLRSGKTAAKYNQIRTKTEDCSSVLNTSKKVNTSTKTKKSSSSLTQSTVDSATHIEDPSISRITPTSSRTSTEMESTKNVRVHEEEKTNLDKNETMRDWLDPLTQSEFIYFNDKKNLVQCPATNKSKGINLLSQFKRRPSQVLNFIKNERKAHLKWIENEINHLENLKHLLSADEWRNFDYNNPQYINKGDIGDDNKHIYDKVASCSTSALDHKTADAIQTSNETENLKLKARSNKKTNNIVALANEHANIAQDLPDELSYKFGNNLSIKNNKVVHARTEQIQKKGRSKLETPESGAEESVRTFARQRKEMFLKTYKAAHMENYDQAANQSDHYSEPRETKKTGVYTSVTSSDFFISSESISLPCTDSSSITTTHQYDSRIGVGVQTTDSIIRTKPVCHCCTQPTKRIYKNGTSKQIQVIPQPIAYVINFEMTNKNKNQMSTESCEGLTLQDHLEKYRPQFTEKSKQRQNALKNLHRLRQEREEQMREIIENINISSISKKIYQLLPPPTTTGVRIFQAKEMKAITRRKYKQLPEVIEKEKLKKGERRKRSNKIMVNIFNKKIKKKIENKQ